MAKKRLEAPHAGLVHGAAVSFLAMKRARDDVRKKRASSRLQGFRVEIGLRIEFRVNIGCFEVL